MFDQTDKEESQQPNHTNKPSNAKSEEWIKDNLASILEDENNLQHEQAHAESMSMIDRAFDSMGYCGNSSNSQMQFPDAQEFSESRSYNEAVSQDKFN